MGKDAQAYSVLFFIGIFIIAIGYWYITIPILIATSGIVFLVSHLSAENHKREELVKEQKEEKKIRERMEYAENLAFEYQLKLAKNLNKSVSQQVQSSPTTRAATSVLANNSRTRVYDRSAIQEQVWWQSSRKISSSVAQQTQQSGSKAFCPYCVYQNLYDAHLCQNCGASLGISLQELNSGTLLQNGRYKIQKTLGQGGFGITYLAFQTNLSRSVTIKEYYPSGSIRQKLNMQPPTTMLSTWRNQISDFVKEAQTVARFSHSSIVKVHDYFEENNTAYFVMEFLEGQTLGEFLQSNKKMSEANAMQLLLPLFDGLRIVHDSGMLHRDLKPDNIFLEQSGQVVLIDFGSARGFADKNLTVRHTQILTQGYAPLEQYASQARFGPYTDIYALGATFYHALLGNPPPDAVSRIQGASLAFPTQLSSQWRTALERMLALSIQDRPQTVTEARRLF